MLTVEIFLVLNKQVTIFYAAIFWSITKKHTGPFETRDFNSSEQSR